MSGNPNGPQSGYGTNDLQQGGTEDPAPKPAGSAEPNPAEHCKGMYVELPQPQPSAESMALHRKWVD